VSSKWSLSLRYPNQNPACIWLLLHTCYIPRPSHSSRFDHPNKFLIRCSRSLKYYVNFTKLRPLGAELFMCTYWGTVRHDDVNRLFFNFANLPRNVTSNIWLWFWSRGVNNLW
jgi:hypothetical protein